MERIIELADVHFWYEEGRKVLEGVNFFLGRGERVGIMGPNGCGKSTTLQIIVGLLKPQIGKVIIFGKERRKEEDFYEVRRRVGLVFQDPDDQLFSPTVEEDLAFGPLSLGWNREKVRRAIKETLEFLGLSGFEKRITYKLSGGEKRLVAMGTVLIMKPEVLLLDEPTGDLSPKNVERIIHVLRNFEGSLVIVSHDELFLKEVTSKILWFDGKGFEVIWEKPFTGISSPL